MMESTIHSRVLAHVLRVAHKPAMVYADSNSSKPMLVLRTSKTKSVSLEMDEVSGVGWGWVACMSRGWCWKPW